MNTILFSEKQRFNRFWIWLTLSSLSSLWFAALAWQIFLGREVGPYPMSDLGIVIMGIILISPVVLFLFLQLQTEVRQDGLYYRLWPISFKWESVSPHQVVKYYIKSRKGSQSKKSLFIELGNSKHLNIGSKRPAELLQAMHRVMQA